MRFLSPAIKYREISTKKLNLQKIQYEKKTASL